MKDIFEEKDGFYHRTEDDDMIGPFGTLEQAQIALRAYVKWLNHDHQSSIRKMREHYD